MSPAGYFSVRLVQSHLLTFVIDIEASGVILILVGDLQSVRMTNLVRLKGGVEVLNGDYKFRAFGLLEHKETDVNKQAHTDLIIFLFVCSFPSM